ncbi:hypothetical protein [Brevundimonas sp. R86498]|uniref:hypothetical protein n=1 Tax=Brevundimonas sp. R86498 TaxID=3093845 RepID=UPI0037C92605
MLAFGLVAAVLAVLLVFPDTGIGRALHRWLVIAPAQALDRVPTGEITFYALLIAGGLILTLLFEAEGLRLFGLLLPDTLVWFALFDVSVFVDALLITGAILASNGLRVLRAQVAVARARVARLTTRISGRARRVRRPARPGRPSNDDDRPAWAGQPGYRAFSMA